MSAIANAAPNGYQPDPSITAATHRCCRKPAPRKGASMHEKARADRRAVNKEAAQRPPRFAKNSLDVR